MEHFAIGFIVEIPAALAGAEDEFLVLPLVALGMDFKAAAINIERRGTSHQLQHGAVAGIAERSLEVDLDVAGIDQQCLHRVRSLPNVLGRYKRTNRCS